ncbi:hypothetical protein KO500_06270 [Cellulophaga baltica]|uniref:DUF6913 domain-containing protein n=1 Tax=Cellulophaga TaxID=104264 RepID=UPI001C078A77|nr:MULTISPECIES: hypothetical protein [Cellulophaga]MBU2996029.1 hypothetical protein [Cellulophaga baltica]MDO6767424.1 hypothetical protein [Cellulophaga sp. 1_MG-2023]
MFLKPLQQKLKFKSGEKAIKQLLENPLKGSRTSKGIGSIGCIVDLDKFSDTNLFYEFVSEFSLRPNSVKIIGYKKLYDKNSPYATPVFSDNDLGWKGAIENGYALEFFSRDYDLLINYYDDEQLLLKLMTLKTKARLRVGFGEIDNKLNDLIINTPIADFSVFKKELKKYLKILREIE